MNIFRYVAVKNYFTKKVKIVRTNSLAYMTFPSQLSQAFGIGKFCPINFSYLKSNVKYKKWVRQRLHCCYAHSSSILLGLNKDDKCVIAKAFYKNEGRVCHAFNEFKYHNKWYIYDCAFDKIYKKDVFYKMHQPQTITSYTLQEILDEYQLYKEVGEIFDKIKVPVLEDNYSDEVLPYKEHIWCKNACYSDAKISLNKNGEVLAAKVKAVEIE